MKYALTLLLAAASAPAIAETAITLSPLSYQDPGGYTFDFRNVPNDLGTAVEVYVSPGNGSMYVNVAGSYFTASAWSYCPFGSTWATCFAAMNGKPIRLTNSETGQTASATVSIVDKFEQCTRSGRVSVCAYLATLTGGTVVLN